MELPSFAFQASREYKVFPGGLALSFQCDRQEISRFDMEPNMQHMWRDWLQQTTRTTPGASLKMTSANSSHSTESSMQKTVHAFAVVAECVAQVDNLVHVKCDSGYHVKPLHYQDRQAIYSSNMLLIKHATMSLGG